MTNSIDLRIFPQVHYYMVYIAHFTELILQICDYAQNDAFDAKIVNMRLTKIFIAIFAPDERLQSSATLLKRVFLTAPPLKIKKCLDSPSAKSF